MANAQVLHAQNVTENTATSATFVDGAIISAANFTAGKEYLIVAVCSLKSSTGSSDQGSRIVHGATPTAFTDAMTVMDPAASDERRTVGWMFRFTQPGTTEDVKVQFNLNSGSGTITHMFSSIIAIKLSDDFIENTNFYWNEVTADTADAASMTDRASITFTPNGTDPWLLIGQASWDIATAGVNFAMRIHDSVGPANYGDDGTFGYPSQDATNDLYNFLYFVAATPSNASHTFSVQTKSATTETVRSTRIVALNLAKFAQQASTYTAAADAPSTGGVWETEAGLSPTPTATGDWVILANAIANVAAADDLLGRLQQNPSGSGLASDPAYGDDAPNNVGSSASRGMPFILMTLKSLSSGAARAINFDFTQTGTGTVRERALIAFSVTLSGGAYTLIAASTSFSETGIAASLLRAAKVIVAQASFALTGQPAGLSHGYQLTAVQATFTETSYAINLWRSYVIGAAVSSFALMGQSVNLLQGHRLAAALTTFALTGINIGFGRGYGFSVSAGSLALTGQSLGLLQDHRLVSSVAPFTLTGNATGLLATRRLGIASGTLALIGYDVILTYGAGYVLSANSRSYLWQGLAIGLRRDAWLTTAMLTLTFIGQNVDLGRSTSFNVARPGMINYGDFKAVRRRKDRRRR